MAADDSQNQESTSNDNVPTEDHSVEQNLEVASKEHDLEVDIKHSIKKTEDTSDSETSKTKSETNAKEGSTDNQTDSKENSSTNKDNTNDENTTKPNNEIDEPYEDAVNKEIPIECTRQMATENEISQETDQQNPTNSNKDNVNNECQITRAVINLQKQARERSNYSQNLKISNSSAILSLRDGKDIKEDNLLKDSTTVVRFSPVWKQTLAASGPILLTFTAGLTSGYSAVLLPQLKNETHGPIHYDDDTASWIASMAALPMAPGCLVSGYIMERFGRRNSHYMICAPLLLGWILIACANNLAYMLAGRFFTGICVGLLGPLGPVYIAETSEPKLRGFFLAGVSLAIALGIFVSHIIGTFMTWQWTATISCLFPIFAIVLLTLVPESPSWLISKGKIEDGVKAFHWLRGYGVDAKIELKGIIDNKKAQDSEPVPTLKEKLVNLKSPELIKPLFIMIIFFITCQFSGVNAVAFYSIEIVEKAVGKGSIDHYLAMLLIDALRVVMSVVACVICKKYGRRPLCMISGIWTAISMVGLSMFLYFKPENMVWLPLTCLMVYISAISIGLVPLPWIMCGEVFPLKVRGLGSGISSALTFVSFFVVVKTAPGMMANFGEVITFLSYGVIALIGTAILYFILPETKGRSLQEIEERFKNGKRRSSKMKNIDV